MKRVIIKLVILVIMVANAFLACKTSIATNNSFVTAATLEVRMAPNMSANTAKPPLNKFVIREHPRMNSCFVSMEESATQAFRKSQMEPVKLCGSVVNSHTDQLLLCHSHA